MNSVKITRWFVYALLTVAVVAIWWSFSSATPQLEEISISQLAQEIQKNEVAEIQVDGYGREITVSYVDEERESANSQISGVSSIEEVLAAYGITANDYAD
ncbi:MAG: ATP-dependent metallopeptidase FtsH/Yme1/Tma family protein, partial [Anaerolineae bacterium]